ncbi:hypothetical protein NH340_JMT09139 [Sarcoptes scabiei]|nr:hypothetical protein NH340_JMT09139 [Sarcoptes scabiei]
MFECKLVLGLNTSLSFQLRIAEKVQSFLWTTGLKVYSKLLGYYSVIVFETDPIVSEDSLDFVELRMKKKQIEQFYFIFFFSIVFLHPKYGLGDGNYTMTINNNNNNNSFESMKSYLIAIIDDYLVLLKF